ncbi:uncharacterized protein DS421_4g121710 [Arachis hypogaea]|nr:uncharacterized protein DS421_4g121710 [Arachis hypogaea]
MHGAGAWRGMVRVWCAIGASLARPGVARCCPARAKGRAEKLVLPRLRRACVGAARKKIGAPRLKIGAWDAARGGNWCARFVAWCANFWCHPNAALPAPRAGQCSFLHVSSSNHGGGKHATSFSLASFCLFLALKDASRSCPNCAPNMDFYISLERSECQLSNANGSTSIGRL